MAINATFTFVGLDELKAALRELPKELVSEAGDIIKETADSAADSVRREYSVHRVTGNLLKGVRVKKETSNQTAVAYKVASTAPHATIFEKGTEARHYITHRGKKHVVGRMPPFNIFGPIMARKRREMWDALWTMLEKHGLMVRGDAA